MSFVAAAIVGGSVVSGAASYFSSKNAAKAQTDAANTATNAQMSMFNTTQKNLSPFIQGGASAIPGLEGWTDPNDPNSTFGHYRAWNDPNDPNSPLYSLLKLTRPGADQTKTLEQTPGYQFQMSQAKRAMDAGLAARGWGGSGGPVAKGSAQYATGLAQSNWQSIVDKLLATYGSGNAGMGGVFNQGTGALQNLANMGANAAAGLGSQATQTGAQIGSNIIGAGNANAGASIAAGNAVGGIGNSFTTAMLFNKLLGGGGGGGSGIYGEGSYENPASGLTKADYDPSGYGVS